WSLGVCSSDLPSVMRDWTWLDSVWRYCGIDESGPHEGGGAACTIRISPNEVPVAPKPMNHARREKSYAPGKLGMDGGIKRARNCMTVPARKLLTSKSLVCESPACKPDTVLSIDTFTRTRGGKSCFPCVARVNRTTFRAL